MKNKNFLLFFLNFILVAFASQGQAQEEQRKFFYDEEWNACFDTGGTKGLNTSYVGQCGDSQNQDLTYLYISWPNPPDFRGASLRGSDISRAILEDAIFSGADLTKVNFTKANLMRSKFHKTTLKQINWSGSILFGADFQEAKLQGADFKTAETKDVNFENSDLSNADFSGNYLSGTNFKSANLSSAKLAGCYFYSTDFSNSDLSDSDLRNSIFFGADLTGADTTGADFRNAKFDDSTTFPFGIDDAKARGMIYYSGGTPKAPKIIIQGNTDGTCLPDTIKLKTGAKVELVLRGNSVMFIFEAPELGISMMAMPGRDASKLYSPTTPGHFKFTCGSDATHPETSGSITVD